MIDFNKKYSKDVDLIYISLNWGYFLSSKLGHCLALDMTETKSKLTWYLRKNKLLSNHNAIPNSTLIRVRDRTWEESERKKDLRACSSQISWKIL